MGGGFLNLLWLAVAVAVAAAVGRDDARVAGPALRAAPAVGPARREGRRGARDEAERRRYADLVVRVPEGPRGEARELGPGRRGRVEEVDPRRADFR